MQRHRGLSFRHTERRAPMKAIPLLALGALWSLSPSGGQKTASQKEGFHRRMRDAKAIRTAAGNGSRSSIESQIDALFARWNAPDSPGYAVGVVRDGKLVFAKGYGMANLEYGVP